MKYRNSIITLGFAVALIQVLGFPQSFDDALYVLIGLSIIGLGYLGGQNDGESETLYKSAETEK